MSHMLNRLVDRTLGLSTGIEPVRTPVFHDGTSNHQGVDESRSGNRELYYSDVIHNMRQPESDDRHAGEYGGQNTTDSVVKPVKADVSGIDIEHQTAFEHGHVTETQASKETYTSTSGQKTVDSGQAEILLNPITPESAVQRLHSTDVVNNNTEKNGLAASDQSMMQTTRRSTFSPVVPEYENRIKSKPDSGYEVEENLPSDTIKPQIEHFITEQNTNPESIIRQEGAITSSIRPIMAKLPPQYNIHLSSGPASPLKENNDVQQAPTIQVTIGRIDVRAVHEKTPVAPAQKQKKRQPSLSLDDYLKQRSENR